MTFWKRMILPFLVLVTAIVYWFLTYEPAGSVLLLIFAIALGVMTWVLGPTLNDVGPTAPVDPDWHERQG
jgi:lipopolysaccharide export LptBFGC system permease protein LptF